ncbi:beta-1,3-galactosyltransferase 5-like [Lingula anatina]|uniref:Hexosyltransferase n=1 Tax=Lingula anatina TaxID=7574 RepID=A0A1S3KAK3_LINAN|nr:beta-1,3-galactosyltransferase 5-like [Lingula anatina]|eukprot:XP_013419668.1 beta-1,3-galactosyltransferase 5-like [Lingula anatina]
MKRDRLMFAFFTIQAALLLLSITSIHKEDRVKNCTPKKESECLVPESVCEGKLQKKPYLWYHIKKYPYIFGAPCSVDEEPFLVVLVISDPRDFQSRLTFRKTCGNVSEYVGQSVKTVFFVGNSKLQHVEEKIVRESEQFGDLIKVDFVDTYKNYTLKAILALRWVEEYCPRTRFVLKSGHDVSVNYRGLIRFLTRRPAEKSGNLFVGFKYVNAPVDRNPRSKHFQTREEFSDSRYPPYVSGFASLLSYDVIKLLHAASLWKHLFIEDVFLSVLAHENHVRLEHNSAFMSEPESLNFSDLCRVRNMLAIHKKPNAEICDLYKDVDTVCKQ